jgi:hypothetical protein
VHGTGIVHQQRTWIAFFVVVQLCFKLLMQRAGDFFDHVPVDADEFERIDGDAGVAAAAGGAALVASKRAALCRFAADGFVNAGVDDGVGFEEQRQPGLFRLVVGERQPRGPGLANQLGVAVGRVAPDLHMVDRWITPLCG